MWKENAFNFKKIKVHTSLQSVNRKIDFTKFSKEKWKRHKNNSVKITEILSHRKYISWNQLFSNFFIKNVVSRNFRTVISTLWVHEFFREIEVRACNKLLIAARNKNLDFFRENKIGRYFFVIKFLKVKNLSVKMPKRDKSVSTKC